MKSAELGARFIGNARLVDANDCPHGLILGFEGTNNAVNTSCILECLDDLTVLANETSETKYLEWAQESVAWVARHAYAGKGWFREWYSMQALEWVPPPCHTVPGEGGGRPLLGDDIFLKAFHRTGIKEYRRIFYETADRLLREESPPGSWINYAPCNPVTGSFHPRQAYLWGYPQIAAYKDSRKAKYLDCAIRAGEWYIGAMRHDGGLFRGAYRDFKTDSFGQETSGIARAVTFWHELWEGSHENRWLAAMSGALKHCMRLQFTKPSDPNLPGAILSNVLYPDGTDRLPYQVRDLGTIFFYKPPPACWVKGENAEE